MAEQFDEAVCIRQADWSETSQIVWLFGRRLGLERALAKGSKRPKAAYSGGVELLTIGEMGVIRRAGSDLSLLTRWDLRRSFPALRESLGAFTAGLYAADLVAHLVREHDPHPGLFDAMTHALDRLHDEAAIPSTLLAFQWAALSEAGFRPELAADVSTGEPLDGASSFLLDPAMGGLLRDSGGNPPGLWRVRATTVELLRRVAASPGDADHAGDADPQTVDRANRLLASYVRHVLGLEPPTMRAAFGGRLLR